MALSDDLTKLASRAKEVEERAAAAHDKTRAELETQIADARAVGEQQAQDLRSRAEAANAEVASWRQDVQRAWNQAVSGIRADVEGKRAERDARHAEKRAERAEEYAQFAIDVAYSGIVEAEYAVLEAALARAEANDKATATA